MTETKGYLGLLHRTLRRLETAVFNEDTPPRDLASLTRRLLELSREIERLESEANAPTATEVEDEPFDPSEI